MTRGEKARFSRFLLDIPGSFVYCVRCFGTSLWPIRSRLISHLISAEGIIAVFRNLVPPKDEGMISILPDMTLDVPDNPVILFITSFHGYHHRKHAGTDGYHRQVTNRAA
jgi:hypothetical protein